MLESSVGKENLDQIICFLSTLDFFQNFEKEALQDLSSSMKLIHLEGGEVLIRQGEEDRSLYILWHGRLRVNKNGALTAEISVGEVVGEISLLIGEPRTATVRAIRDSVLIKIDAKAFEYFESHHPEGVARIAKTAIKRLVTKHHPIQPGENIVTIAVAPAGNSNHIPFLHRLDQELSQTMDIALVTKKMCSQRFNCDVTHIKTGDPLHTEINDWFTSLESQHRFVLYETDHEKTSWTERCLRQADMILFVAEIEKNDEHNAIEEQIYAQFNDITARNTIVAFIHPEKNQLVKGAHTWLQSRPIHGYHHLRMSSDQDFAKLVRFMTGKAFGLVLNGGGAHGFAHVGVLRALEELNITVDCIGGCSIGSAIAGAYALSGLEKTIQLCHLVESARISSDYTFPAVALLKGKNISHFYQKIYHENYIEDLKTRFFCVSSDLTHGKVHVHDKGLLWEAVRASTAIPAVYPPMYDEEGGMLVDGALMNNMPVDVMRQILGGGKILAVDCNLEPLEKNKIIKQSWFSGWKLFFENILPFYKKHSEYDNIFKIIRTALMFSSEKNQEQMRRDADYFVEVETKEVATLKMRGTDEIIELGYRSAMEQLPFQLNQKV